MPVPFYKTLGAATKVLAVTAVGLVLFKAFGWFGLAAVGWWSVILLPFAAWGFVFVGLLAVVVILAVPYAVAKSVHDYRKTK